MTLATRRRLAYWGVLILSGVVVLLAVLQLAEVIDRPNMVIGSLVVLCGVVGVLVPMGWLPRRQQR